MSVPILDPRTGLYRLRPYFEGQRLLISLGTRDEDEAKLAAGEIAKRIWALENGMVELPANADQIEFIKSGNIKTRSENKTLKQLIEAYKEATPEGSKAKATMETERLHFRHLTRLMGEDTKLAQLTHQKIQSYVSSRMKEKFRGKPVTAPTVRKELVSLKMLWKLAVQLKWAAGDCQANLIKLPKERMKEPFLTLGQIEAEFNRRPETDPEIWARAVLIGEELGALLAHVETVTDPTCIHPMVAAAVYTGMRRSELCRSLVSDWDLDGGTVRIRERKRKHNRSESYRWVDLHSDLIKTMQEYLKEHPGGVHMFCREENVATTKDQANAYWKIATRNSRFKHLKGWHCARHSFCSNLASLGVSPALIASYMGHETEEQKARYTHFFPNDRKRAIEQLSFVKPV